MTVATSTGGGSLVVRPRWTLAAFAAVALAVLAFGDSAEDVVGHDGLTRDDPTRLAWFSHHRGTPAVTVASAVTHLGGPAVLGLIALIAGVVLWRRTRILVVSLAPMAALAAAAAAATVVKLAVDRPRPPMGLRLVTESTASFPSGHATDSAALYLTVALVVAVLCRSWWTRAGAAVSGGLIVALVGTSRLILGAHWPSDVLAGWALGTTIALVVTVGSLLLASRVAP